MAFILMVNHDYFFFS